MTSKGEIWYTKEEGRTQKGGVTKNGPCDNLLACNKAVN